MHKYATLCDTCCFGIVPETIRITYAERKPPSIDYDNCHSVCHKWSTAMHDDIRGCENMCSETEPSCTSTKQIKRIRWNIHHNNSVVYVKYIYWHHEIELVEVLWYPHDTYICIFRSYPSNKGCNVGGVKVSDISE